MGSKISWWHSFYASHSGMEILPYLYSGLTAPLMDVISPVRYYYHHIIIYNIIINIYNIYVLCYVVILCLLYLLYYIYCIVLF